MTFNPTSYTKRDIAVSCNFLAHFDTGEGVRDNNCLHISSGWVEISLHTKTQLSRMPGSWPALRFQLGLG